MSDMNYIINKVYLRIKNELIKKGYEWEINQIKDIPSIENITKLYFFMEYTFVVINSGMKNQVAEKIFKKFWGDGITFNFDAVKHPNKNKAIRNVYNRLEFFFTHLLQSKDKLKFLQSLPHIGGVTKYHLARNLGLDYAKPDRHLVRIAKYFDYDDVQEFCQKISNLTNDKIGVVDVILWRFANLNKNYLEIIENWKKEEKNKIGPN